MNELKSLTIGIEEEYQIIDPDSRELTSFISEFLEIYDLAVKSTSLLEESEEEEW